MKKILLVYRVFSDDEGTKGVHRKMLEQGRCLERMGAKVDMINVNSRGIQKDGKLVVIKSMQSNWSRNYFILFSFFKEIKKIEGLKEYDVIYFRYAPLSLGLLGLLKHLKDINAAVKIFIELPTYPFIEEYHGLKKLLVNLVGYRHKHFKKYVTNIVSVGNHYNIWGIPVVQIKNAIDPESYKMRSHVHVDNVLRLVMVSTFWSWHGIDRLVNGMIHYLSDKSAKYKVYLTLVGDGPDLSHITKLAEHPAVKENIFFFPPSYGGELNQLFDQADIAIGTLAVDRLNMTDCSALKHREYGARGIPFVYAGSDMSFNEKDFALKLPLKEAPVDFVQIESFFDKIKNQPIEFSPEAIKNKVKSDLSWETQLQFLLK